MLECGLAAEDADEDLLGGPDAPPYLPGSANHGVLIAFFGCMPSALCGLQACGAQTCGNCGDDDCAAGDRVARGGRGAREPSHVVVFEDEADDEDDECFIDIGATSPPQVAEAARPPPPSTPAPGAAALAVESPSRERAGAGARRSKRHEVDRASATASAHAPAVPLTPSDLRVLQRLEERGRLPDSDWIFRPEKGRASAATDTETADYSAGPVGPYWPSQDTRKMTQ